MGNLVIHLGNHTDKIKSGGANRNRQTKTPRIFNFIIFDWFNTLSLFNNAESCHPLYLFSFLTNNTLLSRSFCPLL